LLAYLEDVIAPDVEVAAKDARFTMQNGRVNEFQAAESGVGIATTTMVMRIEEAIRLRNNINTDVTSTVQLAVEIVEPTISTEDVNDLGITELLGVGISDFSGSPSNRIANIRNAVNKLNGIIVAPGEEFSTIEHTKPYTIAGGYLPEKVIKGDSITPEIGGGLCQIGTTLFRMAMNSGLDITERRNHSLVVAYYNDLENGLPGTDATLYDPAPDFKFKNDTAHHVLIEATMDVSTGLLKFYLWGTSDGREARYTSPTVLEWYNPGEARYIETTDLPPGETQCQSAFRGAYTTFTYTRQLPGAETEEIAYTSRYRALPKICLIGVEEKTICQELPDGSTICDSGEMPGSSPESIPPEVVPTPDPVATSTE
jgi:vancomycin resistance protein YoaR